MDLIFIVSAITYVLGIIVGKSWNKLTKEED